MMMDEGLELPKRRWNIPQVVLAALIVAMVLGVQAVSYRPRMLTNRPWVLKVADIPERANLAQLRDYMETGNYTVESKRYLPPFGLAEHAVDTRETSVMLGYSIREISVLGMPLAAYPENGYVLYLERYDALRGAREFLMTPLEDERLKLLEAQAGAPLARGFKLDWWRYSWGWLLIAMILVWIVLEVRSRIKHREATGIL